MKLSFSSLTLLVMFVQSSVAAPLDLVILHTNDVHARIEETNKFGSGCSEDDSRDGKCYGGVARRASEINRIRNAYAHVLLADAGDQFAGTPWYFYYKGEEAAHFMNLLEYDVMAFGNHEFDGGAGDVAKFLDDVAFPVVCANLNATNEPLIRDGFVSYTEKTYGGETVGIVGYVTKKTSVLVDPEGIRNLVFQDELTQIRQAVEEIKSRGINKIIALGHAGLEMDRKIAQEIDGIDIVIGGHTNSFLYTGEPPSIETPVGPYPLVVTQDSGAKVLVVQDYAFGKYLGFLKVLFNEAGDVTEWEGNPILLDGSIERDAEVLDEVAKWSAPLVNYTATVVGSARVFLDGSRQSCRLDECTMGDLITDALLHNYLLMTEPGNESWSDAGIVLWNGGGIRASVTMGPVQLATLLQVLPFRNEVDMVRIKGQVILDALEHSASTYNPEDAKGGWLQMSGLRVVYNVKRPVGERVLKVGVRCTDCDVPVYEELDLQKEYGVLISSFILNGGDGYSMFKDNLIVHNYLGFLAVDWLTYYFRQHSPILQEKGVRITLVEDEDVPTTGQDSFTDSWMTGGEQSTPGPCRTEATGATEVASLSFLLILLALTVSLKVGPSLYDD